MIRNAYEAISDVHTDAMEGEAMKPKFEERKEVMLAYIEHRGPYDQVPWNELMPRLYGWAKEQKVMPGFHPMGIYHDDPNTAPGAKCRSDIAITFKGEARSSGDVKIKKLPAMKVATLSFKGPAEGYPDAYKALDAWIQEKGHHVTGPSIEVYSKMPEVVDGATILYAKIMMPVEAD